MPSDKHKQDDDVYDSSSDTSSSQEEEEELPQSAPAKNGARKTGPATAKKAPVVNEDTSDESDDEEAEQNLLETSELEDRLRANPRPTPDFPNIKAVFTADNEEIKRQYALARFLATREVAPKSRAMVLDLAASLSEADREMYRKAYTDARDKYVSSNNETLEKQKKWAEDFPELAEALKKRKNMKRIRTISLTREAKRPHVAPRAVSALAAPAGDTNHQLALSKMVGDMLEAELVQTARRAVNFFACILDPSRITSTKLLEDGAVGS